MTKVNHHPLKKILEHLTPEQLEGFRAVSAGKNCFITGGAGTGKSVLIAVITQYFTEQGKNVLLCAPTGIAATNIGGATIHRTFGMPSTVAVTPKTSKIRVRAPKEVASADVLIIDEISMCRMDLFDSIYASLKKVEGKTGKRIQLIVVGDFCQLPPILENKHHERDVLEQFYGRPIKETYAFLSNSWKKCKFTTIVLSVVKRQNNPEFIDALNKARMCDAKCIPYFNANQSKKAFPDSVNLFARNKNVNRENDDFLNQSGGTVYEFDTIFDGTLTKRDIVDIPKSLRLKEGVSVIITANDNSTGISEDPFSFMRPPYEEKKPDYHNGSIGTVLKIEQYPNDPDSDCVVVSLNNGKTLMFYRMKYPVFYYEVNGDTFEKKVLGYYKQFPLHLAHAITVHRSQGQTYDFVNIDPDCPESGQLYVALSRARDISGVHLLHKIQPWNLRLDQCVKDFYANLNNPIEETEDETPVIDADAVESPSEPSASIETEIIHVSIDKEKPVKGKSSSPKGGRPSRFPTGSATLRVPNELLNPLHDAIEVLYPKLGTGKMDVDGIEMLADVLKKIADRGIAKK